MDELSELKHAVRVVQETVIDLVAMVSAIEFELVQSGLCTRERLQMIKEQAKDIAKKRTAERNN